MPSFLRTPFLSLYVPIGVLGPSCSCSGASTLPDFPPPSRPPTAPTTPPAASAAMPAIVEPAVSTPPVKLIAPPANVMAPPTIGAASAAIIGNAIYYPPASRCFCFSFSSFM